MTDDILDDNFHWHGSWFSWCWRTTIMKIIPKTPMAKKFVSCSFKVCKFFAFKSLQASIQQAQIILQVISIK